MATHFAIAGNGGGPLAGLVDQNVLATPLLMVSSEELRTTQNWLTAPGPAWRVPQVIPVQQQVPIVGHAVRGNATPPPGLPAPFRCFHCSAQVKPVKIQHSAGDAAREAPIGWHHLLWLLLPAAGCQLNRCLHDLDQQSTLGSSSARSCLEDRHRLRRLQQTPDRRIAQTRVFHLHQLMSQLSHETTCHIGHPCRTCTLPPAKLPIHRNLQNFSDRFQGWKPI